MKIKLDCYGINPKRAHDTDAGMDLYAPFHQLVPANGSAVVHTGVHVELPKNTVGMIKSRSGLNTKHGIVSEGVIDEGFTGEILVKLYNHSDNDYEINVGDRITQLVVMPVIYTDIEIVDEISGGDRGDSGYGSSGK